MNIKKIGLIGFGVVVIVAAVGYYIARQNSESLYETVVAETRDIIQEVSVTGNVQAVQAVDLAFEQNGRVDAVFVSEGDVVEEGSVLIELDVTELEAELRQLRASRLSAQRLLESARADRDITVAQLAQGEAALDLEKLKLNELQTGSRQEEVNIAKTKVANAEQALEDAEDNLARVNIKAATDLTEDYDALLQELSTSITVARNALNILTDIQFSHFLGGSSDSTSIATSKSKVVSELFGVTGGGYYSRDVLEDLSGGASLRVALALSAGSDFALINQAYAEVDNVLDSLKAALGTVPTDIILSTELASLNSEKSAVDSEIVAVTNKKQAVNVQVAANDQAINTAKSAVNSAKNALQLAEDELVLAEAGTRQEQIDAQAAAVRKAEADLDRLEASVSRASSQILSQQAKVQEVQASVDNAQVRIDKRTLRAPFTGVVTKQNVEVGEIISAQETVLKLIGEDNLQMESFIPEVDIAKVSIDDPARITLDAYGDDVAFTGHVVFIDPADTVIEGVSTYRALLMFDQFDERVRPGMTANIDIVTDTRSQVIVVPQRAVLDIDGQKIVRVLRDNNSVDVSVQAGLRGSDGFIEIISGVNAGDRIILFERNR